jgi:hypothetical protein
LSGQHLQEDFETWAKDEYPDIWARLVKRGRKETIDGLSKFKLARELKA